MTPSANRQQTANKPLTNRQQASSIPSTSPPNNAKSLSLWLAQTRRQTRYFKSCLHGAWEQDDWDQDDWAGTIGQGRLSKKARTIRLGRYNKGKWRATDLKRTYPIYHDLSSSISGQQTRQPSPPTNAAISDCFEPGDRKDSMRKRTIGTLLLVLQTCETLTKPVQARRLLSSSTTPSTGSDTKLPIPSSDATSIACSNSDVEGRDVEGRGVKEET